MSFQESLIVANCQLTSIDDLGKNLEQIEGLLKQISGEKLQVDLICFPENSLYMRLKEGEVLPRFQLNSPAFAQLQSWATKYQWHIHLGSLPLEIDGRLFNSSVLLFPNGKIEASYQKIHLFDIQLAGQKPHRESDVFAHGTSPRIFELKGWRVGQSVCFDLRFSELYHYYAKQGCDLLLVPSAFLVKTGQAHWDVLLRARAIESQAYVIASAQGGRHQGSGEAFRETFGNSLTIDPWGTVINRLEEAPGFSISVLQKVEIRKVREQIPMLRRL